MYKHSAPSDIMASAFAYFLNISRNEIIENLSSYDPQTGVDYADEKCDLRRLMTFSHELRFLGMREDGEELDFGHLDENDMTILAREMNSHMNRLAESIYGNMSDSMSEESIEKHHRAGQDIFVVMEIWMMLVDEINARRGRIDASGATD